MTDQGKTTSDDVKAAILEAALVVARHVSEGKWTADDVTAAAAFFSAPAVAHALEVSGKYFPTPTK